METEPVAATPKRKRHRFQFRLGTLLGAVTLFCASAAAFTAYNPVRYESAGPGLYFLAFGLLAHPSAHCSDDRVSELRWG